MTTHPGRGPFDVWAPRPERVRLVLRDDTGDGDAASYEVVEMTRQPDGWWTPAMAVVDEGETSYGFLVGDAEDPGDPVDALPDPRSLRQPDGVHGLSRTFDLAAHDWTDGDWRGRQLAGSVIYELHIGTFTPEGTLDAAIAKLPHLVSLGVDLVEVMPVNAVNGVWNWGYDGVLWNCVHEPYGGPAAYQRFVDACHAAGLGVVQDVVYNHLGPSGNYLPEFGPYLKSGANTWGDLVNLDTDGSDEVRRLILDNVRMWFRDFHVDALRLDAVHALDDSSEVHLLEEMAIETAALSAHLGRPLTLIAESDLNDTKLVTPREGGGYGLDAQWSDDFHHAVHVALSGETTGYYEDFAPLSALAKVCNEGFFHAGTYSSFRGRDHGVPIDRDRMPTWRLVVSNQNHDQIGNRARGDRLTEHLDEHQLGCAALLTLAGPFTPMLFMGEEYAASTPFAFFTSHPEPDLGKATAEGRIKEFERMGWDPDEVLDPQDPATFEASKLDWAEADGGRGARVLARYRELAELRRTIPALTDPHFANLEATADEDTGLFLLRRRSTVPGPDVLIAVNTGDAGARVDLGDDPELAFTTGDGVRLTGGGLELPAHAGALVLTARVAG
ncbi:maltooligosyltrehalose trehalohydrolase [Nocardioides massiliensis]|uniref:Malto-oligosyltrehalose trehalohydrolase n=2 Tax=Nocardioides massiliensis TaxID=1325935 RepID=A0ABT9NLI2_9ACTN|nr:malto-oligosyltrehalose trehalohydrolase [Nocardioides massiliensis]MDP9821087.1 maltooligosyltrehalose trehalohydrolase [Nocardioides massiliensis]